MALEQAADDRDAEGRMVDVSVTGDEQDIQLVPAALGHLGTGTREEGGGLLFGTHRRPPLRQADPP